jgi:hypothetical protein
MVSLDRDMRVDVSRLAPVLLTAPLHDGIGQ